MLVIGCESVCAHKSTLSLLLPSKAFRAHSREHAPGSHPSVLAGDLPSTTHMPELSRNSPRSPVGFLTPARPDLARQTSSSSSLFTEETIGRWLKSLETCQGHGQSRIQTLVSPADAQSCYTSKSLCPAHERAGEPGPARSPAPQGPHLGSQDRLPGRNLLGEASH